MGRKRKAPDAGREGRRQDTEEFKPGGERPRKAASGMPATEGSAAPPQSERSEDFGRRRDIETADEPAEEHDRRHHDQDAEVGRPV